MWLPLTALLLAAAPAQNEAHQLLERMEQRVFESTSLAVRMELAVAGKDVKGRLLLGRGTKMRLELEMTTAGKPHKAVTVSDGALMRTLNARPRRNEETPGRLNDIFKSSLTRGGVWMTMVEVLENEDPAKGFTDFDRAKHSAVSDFKLGPKEPVSGREAQAVDYRLSSRDELWDMTVWIDLHTHLPLKRVVKHRPKDGPDQVILTETYLSVGVDEKVDDKEFEIPK